MELLNYENREIILKTILITEMSKTYQLKKFGSRRNRKIKEKLKLKEKPPNGVKVDQRPSTFFTKLPPFKNVGPHRPSFIKRRLPLFESFCPEIYAENFLQKYGTHKEKQRQFIKIQQYVKMNINLAAGVALQD